MLKAKPKVSRSRSGCRTCRSRGYKCDETKPICRQCSRLGIACGYVKQLKWVQATEGRKVGSNTGAWVSSQGVSKKDDWKVQNSKYPNKGNTGSELVTRTQVLRSLSSEYGFNNTPRYSLSYLPELTPMDHRLLSHWLNHLSPILSTSPNQNGNQYFHYITPMALSISSSALFAAFMALNAAHIAQHDRAFEYVALRKQGQAISYLKEVIKMSDCSLSDETLAAVLLMRIFEDFSPSPNSLAAAHHIGGAASIVSARGGPRAFTSPISSFLLSNISYYDVVSTVSLERPPFLQAQTKDSFVSAAPEMDLFVRYTGTLLSLISGVSSLLVLSKNSNLQDGESILSLKRTAAVIKRDLYSWSAPKSYPASHRDYILTAEAYKNAGLIYLSKVSGTHIAPDLQHAAIIKSSSNACLEAIASVPISSPVVVRQLYPLFTAACETFSQAHRELAMLRFQEMKATGGGLRNIGRVEALVREVWRSKDWLKNRGGEEENASCNKASQALGCFEVMRKLGKVVLTT